MLSRLRAKTKVRKLLVRELLYAEDAAIVADSDIQLQSLVDKLSAACQKFGLNVSQSKTKILVQNTNTAAQVSINGQPLEIVDHFCYLLSIISNNTLLDKDINNRIAKAMATMSRLQKRVWDNILLTSSTKALVYRTCVLSTLLYGSETWSTYSWQEKKLKKKG
ncbi:Craniofacial development 2 [Biomphalaria glabrata]